MNTARPGLGLILLWALAVAVYTVGVFRIGEIVAAVTMRAAGSPSPELAQLLGFAAVAGVSAVAVLVVFRARRPGNKSFSLSSFPDEPAWTPDQLDVMAALRDLASRETSPLRKVVAIGASIRAGDVMLDAIAVELRETVGRVTFAIHDPVAGEEQREFDSRLEKVSDLAAPGWPSWLIPVVRISDDSGRSYYSTHVSGGGGSEGTYRHELAFAPGVPPDVSALTLTIDRMTTETEFPIAELKDREPRVIEGPWVFHVPL